MILIGFIYAKMDINLYFFDAKDAFIILALGASGILILILLKLRHPDEYYK